jgi:hypothetical protein
MGMFDDLLKSLESWEHPLVQRKRENEARGFANHTVPPNLDALTVRGDSHLTAGAQWVLRNDWNTAYSIQLDLELIAGSGMGFEIAEFGARTQESELDAEEDVAAASLLDQERAAAAERLKMLEYLPPSRWHELYEDEGPNLSGDLL